MNSKNHATAMHSKQTEKLPIRSVKDSFNIIREKQINKDNLKGENITMISEDCPIKHADLFLITKKLGLPTNQLSIFAYSIEEEDTHAHLFIHHDIILNKMPSSTAVIKSKKKESSYIAVGTIDQTIQIWDLYQIDPLRPVFTLKEGSRTTNIPNYGVWDYSISCLGYNWSNCLNELASGSGDGTIKFWNLTRGVCTEKIKYHQQTVSFVAWNPQTESNLLTGAYDRTLATMDMRSPGLLTAFWQATSEVEAGLWNPFDPTTIVLATGDGLVTCFDMRMNKLESLFQLHAHKRKANRVAFSAFDPGVLATSGNDGKVKLWDVSKQRPKILASLDFEHRCCSSLEFCPTHPYIIAASDDTGAVSLWEFALQENGLIE